MDPCSLICVRPPYFALRGIRADATPVEAVVPVEQDLARERGPLSGAEAERLLAVRGSYALARVNPSLERHYYLATSAELELLAHEACRPDATLHGQAHAWFTSRRAGRARSTLFSSTGLPLYGLDVSYMVL